jgi:heme o synthase
VETKIISQSFTRFKIYSLLAKPGIILGNAITAFAGFALASKGHIDIFLLLATLSGLSCVIGSACVFNNYIDREADSKMARTQHRALANGTISVHQAILFAIFLCIAGFGILLAFTNLWTVSIAALGVLVYVFLYSFSKYKSVFSTVIGSVAGAIPPVIGYCSVSGRLDLCAGILFLIVALWQMPHFYAIALYRLEDYAIASIPILPIIKGIRSTKVHMLLYILGFMMACLLLPLFGYTGMIYLSVAVILNILWIGLSVYGFKCTDDQAWARKMFLLSLQVITLLSIMISIDGHL